MSAYRRIVSYLYKYSQGKKAENTGFVRVENREDGLRLQIHLKDLKMMDERKIKIYFYFHEKDKIKTIFVDEFTCLRGNCEYKKSLSLNDMNPNFEKMSGMIFRDKDGLLYGSCWDEKEIIENAIIFEMKKSEQKLSEQEKSILPGQVEEKNEIQEIIVADTEEVPTLESNEIHTLPPMNQLLSSFPKLTLIDNPNFIEAVKIDLSDISKLSYKDWKLAENAFLRQGYETYEYLMFGKIEMQPNQIIWILGVPGTYDNREKYLANIFGFFDYIPEEKSKFRTGGKGYWITRLTEL